MNTVASRVRVDESVLKKVAGLPLLLEVEAAGGTAMDWATEHCSAVQRLVASRGALLLRGLKIHGSAQFGQLLSTFFGGELLEYNYRSTPRTALRGNVYTATEYPASEVIPQHNENAYSRRWPNRIGFLCMLPPATGGETPISATRLLSEVLPRSIQDKFQDKGIMYVRNYSNLDLPWKVVFQTEDRSEVEAYCKENELSYEWLEDNGLRTRQVNPATAIHPLTGETLWFNQAHLFHVSSLGRDMAATLTESLGEENLPRNAFYGDGTPIEFETLEVIRDAYQRTKVKFQWQRDDLLLLDNMLYTHGRESYTGPRKVLTGMACPNC